MNAKLIVEGKEFDIQIMDPELQKLIKPPKKTGYERVDLYKRYWFDNGYGTVSMESDDGADIDDQVYNNANYYSDETVARNNVRADNLMRQLRRFAVECRENNDIDWKDDTQSKWFVVYNYRSNELYANCNTSLKISGAVYFDSCSNCELAIEKFKDELTWLFTEYKDSL